jgi:hypothetical protein
MRLLGSRAFQPCVPRTARRRADDLARELTLIRTIPRPARSSKNAAQNGKGGRRAFDMLIAGA